MKPLRVVLLVLTLSFCSETLSAQTSIGFRNPGNTASLKEYRLPAWSYQRFFLDGDGYFSSSTSENPSNSAIDDRVYFSSSLSGAAQWYSEHDDRIMSFSAYPGVSGFFYSSKITFADDSENSLVQTGYETPIALYSGLKWYVMPSLFLDASPSISFRRTQSVERYDPNIGLDRRSTSEYTDFQTTQSFGIGFGRVRNVTPVIRALRFYERLAQLHPERTESQDNIIETASVFAKLTGYMHTYDRSEKAFWSDVMESADVYAESMRPFDVLYLMETNSEALIDRFEGWDVQIGPRFYASRQLDKQRSRPYEMPDYRDYSVAYRYGAGTMFRYYVNPSLNRMFAFHISGNMEKWSRDGWNNSSNPIFTSASISAHWLEQVADRFSVQQWISALYRQNQFENSDIKTKSLNVDYMLRCTYFIENSTSLYLNFQIRRLADVFDAPLYGYGSDVKGYAQASIGIRHYFGRSANL